MTSPYIEEAARRAAAIPSSHTPGPWSYDRANGLVTANEVRDWPAKATVSAPVAQTYRAANARLIASAPDLLAAVKENKAECEAWLKTDSIGELRQTLRNVIERSQTAIAKATQP